MTVGDMDKHAEHLEKCREDLILAEAEGLDWHQKQLLRAKLEEAIMQALRDKHADREHLGGIGDHDLVDPDDRHPRPRAVDQLTLDCFTFSRLLAQSKSKTLHSGGLSHGGGGA